MNLREYKQKIIDFLTKETNCYAIVIFGSFARNTQRIDSDIDIAIKTDKKLSNKDIFHLQNALANMLNIDVDLIDLSSDLGDGFRYEILINGVLIYCTRKFEFDLYKLRMFREYLELNESRAEILQNIKDGKVNIENKAVVISKYDIIKKCINRINEEYNNSHENLEDYRKEECIVLNLQRVCEAVIDIAMHEISTKKLGIPQTKLEAIELLYKNGLINEEYYNNVKNIIKFINIAVHGYRKIEPEILQDVIENHLKDLEDFAKNFI